LIRLLKLYINFEYAYIWWYVKITCSTPSTDFCVQKNRLRRSVVERSVGSARDRGSWASFVEVSHWMGYQNLLSQAPPWLMVPAVFAVVNIHSSFKEGWRQAGADDRKNKCRIFITPWWKHVVPTPLSGIRIGRRRRTQLTDHVCNTTLIHSLLYR
jgi:hypothetical protein